MPQFTGLDSVKAAFDKVHIYLVFLVYALTFALVDTDADLDLWHRLAAGQIFAQVGGVINHDIFAYFPQVDTWIDHEWLSGVIFYQVSHFFGDAGILTLKILVIFAILTLMYLACQIISPDGEKRVVYYLLAAFSIMPGLSSTLRCQAFTYLFFALWIYLLERVKRGENRLIWLFPATMLVWTNVHGGFLAGIGLVALFMFGELLNRQKPHKYLLIILACLPALFASVYGLSRFATISSFFSYVGQDKSTFSEWQPMPLFGSITDFFVYKILVLGGFAVLIYKFVFDRRRIDWVEPVLLCSMFLLSLTTTRHLVFFTITAVVFSYKYYSAAITGLSNWINRRLPQICQSDTCQNLLFTSKAFFYIFAIGLCAMLIAGKPFAITLDYYPTKAIEFIKVNNLKGNLLVPFNWGSYAMWKLYPSNLISMDGRYEQVYTHQAYIDVYNCSFIKSNSNWHDSFNTYRHDVLLVDKRGLMQRQFRTLKNWRQVYEDEKAVIFVPAVLSGRKWELPSQDATYYIKTKYENGIMF
jgi:hypothetical protein